ncbi:MAG: 1-deoxy-D-xylulose-5-phosphate reductoisomerase [Epsilonproteobacteria bacterium]|nr:1-deoxy-D-xylulose-5-phosphate reductoisomerase [Campylobacterota bacterium]
MVLLGSTGSIGVNALAIAQRFGLEIEALVAGYNVELLNQQISQFHPKFVAVANQEIAKKVNHDNVLIATEGIEEIINQSNSKIVINALVGEVGLMPTIMAIKANKKVALANKESLVIAGKFIDTSQITPIDSEHFGLWYLLNDKKPTKLIITASGGALRDYPIDNLPNVSLKEVLNHPNWSMGNKITIDSATMVNKLFEILEAKWLFDIDNIDALIHRSSIIHSLIEFVDGSTTAHIANADMKLPIAFALLQRVTTQIIPPVDLTKVNLSFEEIDTTRYPIWQLKDELLKNPDLGVVINTVNEFAIQKFINNEISFVEISRMILEYANRYHDIKLNTLDDLFLAITQLKKQINML